MLYFKGDKKLMRRNDGGVYGCGTLSFGQPQLLNSCIHVA